MARPIMNELMDMAGAGALDTTRTFGFDIDERMDQDEKH